MIPLLTRLHDPQRCRRTESPSDNCYCPTARLLFTLKARYLRVQELVHWLG
ncbi:hypothetical protein DPMN_118863 [Dreissena polymorpha]|uniref:Uncharacterized protein n=1 Tax=Dreissena polymorpha TaxID=45954 RepID=A0A9D4GHT1_DREPO|nr:hypothetical protein DPMN_118863 [Dreissena polymorpha]